MVVCELMRGWGLACLLMEHELDGGSIIPHTRAGSISGARIVFDGSYTQIYTPMVSLRACSHVLRKRFSFCRCIYFRLLISPFDINLSLLNWLHVYHEI